MREDPGEGTAVREGALRLNVAVHNAMLAEALSAAAVRAGWAPVPVRCLGVVLVTDRTPSRVDGHACSGVVLVCEPTAFAARGALNAISELAVAGIVCSDEPADVGHALAGLASGQASVPLRVMALAAAMPALTERQLAVLAAVAAGRSNIEIGRCVHLSQASVKRELAVLYSALGTTGRPALAAKAVGLGVLTQMSS